MLVFCSLVSWASEEKKKKLEAVKSDLIKDNVAASVKKVMNLMMSRPEKCQISPKSLF